MLNVQYYINGVAVNWPFNHKELSIELNFDTENTDAEVVTNEFTFVNEEAKLINDWINDGLTGGFGVFHGIPFKIFISDDTASHTFEMYLDLTDGANISCNQVSVRAKEYARIDWLNDIADSFTFEYLHEKTIYLPSSKFVAVPYIINNVPNYREIFLVIFSMIFVAEQLKNAISIISGKIAGASNPFVSLSAFLELSLYILYVITLLITIVKLISDIIDLIIQPVKYHKGMYVKDLIESGCNFLNIGFSSTILSQYPFNKLLILPRKFENPQDIKDERISGFLSPNVNQTGFYEGTFGQLLRDMKILFNAKIILIDNILHFERKDWNSSTPTYTLPNVRNDFYGLNTNEFTSNYLIEFLTDVNDKNTIQEYKGTIYQASIQPNSFSDRRFVLHKNLKQATIPFALGKRKEKLTLPEKLFDTAFKGIELALNGLITVVNAVIKALNTIGKAINVISNILSFFGFKNNLKAPSIDPIPKTNFSKIINDRLGMLMLDNDAVYVPKLLMIEQANKDRNTKILTGHKDLLSAKNIWDKFWHIDSFVPFTGNSNANQWYLYSVKSVPFCLNDFLKVRQNNYIYTANGEIARIDSLKWNIYNQTADIDFRVNKLYTNNINISYSEGKGY